MDRENIIPQIISALEIKVKQKEDIKVNQIINEICKKYKVKESPKYGEIMSSLPENLKPSLIPYLKT